MRYRRSHRPGGSFFFTVVTAHREPVFVDSQRVSLLRQAMRRVCESHPFRTDAIVVLPDHLHCIWTLPGRDSDFATRWRLIKTRFTQALRLSGPVGSPWQKRYWEHTIRNEADLQRHIDYIHYNPVKHGYVKSPAQWPHSSFHRYVAAGRYAADWGCDELVFDDIGNE